MFNGPIPSTIDEGEEMAIIVLDFYVQFGSIFCIIESE